MMLELIRALLRLPAGASSIAAGVDLLHAFVIGTTLLGVFGISVTAAYLLVRYRHRPGDHSTPKVEVTGKREAVIVVGTLSLFIVWWVIGYRQYLDMRRRPGSGNAVYVVGKQWMWKFSYGSGQVSNNVLTVPVGAPVELIMTSRDVIHSFFVPAMRLKQDVVPGRYVTLWFQPTVAGTYPIFCAEYCGVSHSAMLGEVRVLESADYERFLADATAAQPLSEYGRRAAVKHACLSCHTVDGQPHIGPTWSRLYGSVVALANGERITADAAYLTESMMDPAARLVAGYRPVMPTYLGSLDPSETAAIVEYIRSLRDAPISPSVVLPPTRTTEGSPAAPGSQGAQP